MNVFLTLLLIVFAVTGSACSSGSDSSSGDADTDANGNSVNENIRIIAGNSAIGRAGSWSNNCIGTACARADNEGNYLLSAELTASSLVSSDIPMNDGTITRLYSRYRHDATLKSRLININPSTQALLDAYAWANQGRSIADCALSVSCETDLMNGFTESIESTMVSRLGTLLGSAWPAGRNPFDDVYIADATQDNLDLIHDTLNFVVTQNSFQVLDNEDSILIDITPTTLLSTADLTEIALTDDQYSTALALDRDDDFSNPITISARFSPSRPDYPPLELTVDAQASRTDSGGTLTFIHELTLATGETALFSGVEVDTTITTAGTHVWVVTAIDSEGYSDVQGYSITVLADEESATTYGGDGSCVTPQALMTNNTLNVCEEIRDGSSIGECDVIESSTVTLISSPAPCSSTIQNGGNFIGICTIEAIETRVFYYENPERANNIETIDEKRIRLSSVCDDLFDGVWSTTP